MWVKRLTPGKMTRRDCSEEVTIQIRPEGAGHVRVLGEKVVEQMSCAKTPGPQWVRSGQETSGESVVK